MWSFGVGPIVLALALPATPPDPGPPRGEDALAARLRPLIEAHRGQVAVMVRHLETGESFAYRADEAMPTASLIKLAVMVEVYRQAAAGRVDLAAPVTLHQEDKVPGSGILTPHFSAGASFPLRDAVRLMIAFSDNTATNLVLDRIGIDATSRAMADLGFPNTRIYAKVYRRDTSVCPERSRRFGLGSTTAAEMVRLCAALHRREFGGAEAGAAMLEHLKACDDRAKFPRFLPPGTSVAFKTGSVDAARTAAGIVYSPAGPIALCVLTSGNEDRRWTADNAGDRLCAEVARAAYQHFNPSRDGG